MKALIIGLGSIGVRHAETINRLYPEIKLYALRNSKSQNNFDFITNIYSLDQINFVPLFIIISNPTYIHGTTIENCIKFGCPLFIEKPITSKILEAEQLLIKLRDKNILTYVGCNLRFHPILQYFKNNFSKLKPLEVNIYSGSFLPKWRPNNDYKNSYSSHKKMGGGVHLDLIHEIDYCTWLFGFPNKISSLIRKVSNLEIDSCDYAHYLLDFETFITCITLNYFRKEKKRQLEVIYENGLVNVDLINNKIFSNDFDIDYSNSYFELQVTYDKQMTYFIENIKRDLPFENDFSTGLKNLKIALNEK